jgi:hypothetical protein
MSLWEYKVISSGKGGFATPALLEKFLNDLGRDEWEIIEFRTASDNALAFSGLARRSTQRDWTLEDAAAAAARTEAEKLRAEFEAKFKAATSPAPAEERPASFIEEKLAPDDGFRKPVDTSHDAEPEDEEEAKADEWDKLAGEDDLPTFFEAMRPHMRKNQRGPGMSVGVDYLAKKWDQSEEDIKGALAECGFVIPEDEDAKAEYLEYDGDLFWVNVNRRGELGINTKEKPRPVFRTVKAQKVVIEEQPKPEPSEKPERNRKPESAEELKTQNLEPETAAAAAPLPTGPELLNKIRPHMRRNRRGPGGSGSSSFLSRALKCSEADLKTAFTATGLTVPSSANEKPVYVEFGNEIWWVNADSRGGLWINGRDKKPGEVLGAETAASPGGDGATPPPADTPAAGSAGETAGGETAAALPAQFSPAAATGGASETLPTAGDVPAATDTAAAAAGSSGVLAAFRAHLKPTRTGAIAAKLERVAEELSKTPDEITATLVGAGLKVPEKPREKPVFVEHAGEIFWLNLNAKGELWLNAKASKFADKDEDDDAEAEKKPRRGRSTKESEPGS